MRPFLARLTTLALAAAAAGGCSSTPGVRVNTTTAPAAQFAAYHTFAIMTPRLQNQASNPAASDDPMVDNSATNQALKSDIQSALVARGYTPAAAGAADFRVAYYTASKQKLDV